MQKKISGSNFSNSSVKWRKLIKNINFIVFIILGTFCVAYLFYYRPSNCQAVYDVMRELKTGMSRENVLLVIKKYDKPYIVKSYDSQSEYFSEDEAKGQYISIWVHYTLLDTLRLSIWLHDNKLYKTKLRGEDGIETFRDAPPDILPDKQLPSKK